MAGKYTKDPSKLVFKLNKKQFEEITTSKPLTRLLCEHEEPIMVTDYVIRTDNRVGHEMNWNELGHIVKLIDGAFRSDSKIDDIFKVKQTKRDNNIKPGYMEISLPNMETILNENTDGYLVLVAEDKTNVIMPKYFEYMVKKLDKIEPKGKITKNNPKI